MVSTFHRLPVRGKKTSMRTSLTSITPRLKQFLKKKRKFFSRLRKEAHFQQMRYENKKSWISSKSGSRPDSLRSLEILKPFWSRMTTSYPYIMIGFQFNLWMKRISSHFLKNVTRSSSYFTHVTLSFSSKDKCLSPCWSLSRTVWKTEKTSSKINWDKSPF